MNCMIDEAGYCMYLLVGLHIWNTGQQNSKDEKAARRSLFVGN